jgi:diacylglycerol kinase (ATP)
LTTEGHLVAETVSGTAGSSAPFAALIYNPIKVDLPALQAAAASAEAQHGWAETRWLETSKDDPGQGVAAEAVKTGARVIIAAGGDGTVRAVAEVVADSESSLALLPSGTGNLLARNLSLTLDDVAHSIETAFGGDDRKIDLGRIEIEGDDGERTKHAFVVMAGLGLDAKMLAKTDDELKAKVGWLAYVGALGSAMRDKNQLDLRYRLDGGRQVATKAHTIIVGNCGSLPANVLLLPDAAVDDGLFDIVLLRPNGVWGWLQIWFKIIWENGVLRRTQVGRKILSAVKEVRVLRYFTGKEIVIRLDRAEDIELDGDSAGTARAVKISIDHGGLTVRVPKEAAAS